MASGDDVLLPTKVFAKAGLDNETSAMCYYQQQFRLDIHYSALVLNFNHIFSIGHLYRLDNQGIPCLRKYSNVMCHTAQQFYQCWGDSKNVLYHLGLT